MAETKTQPVADGESIDSTEKSVQTDTPAES